MLWIDLPLWLDIILGIILTIILVIILIPVSLIIYFNWHRGKIQRLGLDGPKPNSIFMGMTSEGPLRKQSRLYKEYKNKKVFGMYVYRDPVIIVTDLDMVREILVTNFNCFANKRPHVLGGPSDFMTSSLKDDQWKHVRNTVSRIFSKDKLRLMSTHVEAAAKLLVENLIIKIERRELVELEDTLSHFSLDAMAGAGFGVQTNSKKDPGNSFVQAANKALTDFGLSSLIGAILPFLLPLGRLLGLSVEKSTAVNYFVSLADKAMATRNVQCGISSNDFLHLLVSEHDKDVVEHDGQTQEEREDFETATHRRGLTKLEIQGQALTFVVSGNKNVCFALSLTLFHIAMNAKVLKRVQEELDEKLGHSFPNDENVQELTYLDMCVSEGLRLHPPEVQIGRLCGQEVEIQGFKFPKGYLVGIPVYAIHHDPDLWPDPETFDPERFSPENKARIHPYTYLPFGHGPRNCIDLGMRLALLEMKIALAAVLQVMTPLPCVGTVYPVRLHKTGVAAEGGLWLNFVRRNLLTM